MKNNKLEYIRVTCLIVIALCLTIIAWKTVSLVNVLESIQYNLDVIESRINELK